MTSPSACFSLRMGVRTVFLLLKLNLAFIGSSFACTLVGYDIATLSSANYWVFDVPQTNCVDVGAASCKVYFSVCNQLSTEICGTQVSLCEKDWASNGSSSAYTASVSTYEASGASILFKWSGGNFSNCSMGTTTIALQCSQKARWDSTHPNVTSYFISLNKDPTDACNVTITMEYAGACLTTPTSTIRTLSPHKFTNHRKLALVVVLSILCILIIVVLFYLVVGVIFQVAVKKERGIRIIPNYDFWQDCCSSMLCCKGVKRGGAKYDHFGEEPDETL